MKKSIAIAAVAALLVAYAGWKEKSNSALKTQTENANAVESYPSSPPASDSTIPHPKSPGPDAAKPPLQALNDPDLIAGEIAELEKNLDRSGLLTKAKNQTLSEEDSQQLVLKIDSILKLRDQELSLRMARLQARLEKK